MNYILNHDHSYIMRKYIKKSDLSDMKYCLIDISTDRKGPIFTAVDDVNFDFDNDVINVTMDITYSPKDYPGEGYVYVNSNFKIDSIEKMYNIHPLIQQMFGFNIYRNNLNYNDSFVLIDGIDIYYKNTKISIDEEDPKKEIKKIFRNLKMITCTQKLFGANNKRVLIFFNNKWSIVEYNLLLLDEIEFDKIGVPIDFSNSFYLMTRKEYDLFRSIDALEISLLYSSDIERSDDIVEYDPEDDMINISYCTDLPDILSSCLYIPQMILLEKEIYKDTISIYIMVECHDRQLNLLITDKELSKPKNICLYSIIKKLLKM